MVELVGDCGVIEKSAPVDTCAFTCCTAVPDTALITNGVVPVVAAPLTVTVMLAGVPAALACTKGALQLIPVCGEQESPTEPMKPLSPNTTTLSFPVVAVPDKANAGGTAT